MAHALPHPPLSRDVQDDRTASAWPADPALGRTLGRDYARHGLIPPPEHLGTGHPVRQGWEAARPQFAQRPRAATPAAGLILQTRLQAWLRGIAFETLTVTPALVRQIAVSHCPVTRAALALPGSAPSAAQQALSAVPAGAAPMRRRAEDRPSARPRQALTPPAPAVLARLRPDAAYAAGHLALLSPLADAAQADLDLQELLEALRTRRQAEHRAGTASAAPGAGPGAHTGVSVERDTRPALARLDNAQLGRLAVLRSFVEPLAAAQAAALPLLVLPPNRLRLLNPHQALQVLLTRQLERSGWSKRLPRLEQLAPAAGLPDPGVRTELRSFFYVLMSRCIAAGRPGRRPADQQAWRWTLEDAWRHPQVLQAWTRLARQVSAAQAEAWVALAGEAGLCTQAVQVLSPAQATEGWDLPPGQRPAPDTVALDAQALAGVQPFGSLLHRPAAEPSAVPVTASVAASVAGPATVSMVHRLPVRHTWRPRGQATGALAGSPPLPGPTEQLSLPM